MDRHDYTDMGGPAGVFWTTHWSLIENARSADHDGNRLLIDMLLRRYWKPIYCFLRRKGYGNEQAKDLTQGFFHEVVLGRHLIEKVEPARGRFRSLLLIALDRYLANVHRAEAAYDYVWVSTMLEQVLEEVKAECSRDGMVQHWNVFHDRVLAPIVQQGKPPALGEICTRYGIENERQASNMVVTMKRRMQAALAQRLRETVSSEEEVGSEMEAIRGFFLRAAQQRP